MTIADDLETVRLGVWSDLDVDERLAYNALGRIEQRLKAQAVAIAAAQEALGTASAALASIDPAS